MKEMKELQRFILQYKTSEKYIIPYTGVPDSILEIGCGEGGNLLPYFNRDCKITGIDKSDSKIDHAQCFYPFTGTEFINADIFNYKSKQQYDLIIMKDVLEHLPGREYVLWFLINYFMYPETKIFITFSPWSMPFGGHQHCCKSFLRYIPYLHLFPFYKFLLDLLEDAGKIKALMDIKKTRLSVKWFKAMIRHFYKIEKETFWFINPSYDARFGIKPIKFINIPFLTTSYWCLISKK